jgi:hypothetical protein
VLSSRRSNSHGYDSQVCALFDLVFEQHADIEIEVPYIGMVELFYDGEVSLGDDPVDVWDEARR